MKIPALLALALLAAPLARACSVPVYRYALERWPADPFDVAYFHEGELGETETALLEKVNGKGLDQIPNALSRDINVQKMEQYDREMWESQKDATLPWTVISFPEPDRIVEPLWTGKLDAATADNLLDSPARREIARRILQGDSAVFVLLESADAGANSATEKLLATELPKLEQTLEIPEQDPEDPSARLTSPVPLKVAFSTLHIRRDDPAEKMFVRMLLQSADGPREDLDGPVVFPIFGRGRSLGALRGELLDAETIASAAAFLVGSCSCEVKALNPGVDMLMSVNWDDLIEGTAVIDEALPPLTGLGSIVQAASEPAIAPVLFPPVRPVATTEAPASGALGRTVFLALGAGGILVAGVGFLLLRGRA